MKILLTNDDGIDSPGIQKLAEIFRSSKNCDVTLVAPDQNRSGVSNGISILNAPVKLRSIGSGSWVCSGTPADCIISAVKGILKEKPDLVVSGINRGANLGTDLIFSGTAAGARQASLYGIPAIAVSLNHGSEIYHWDMAVSWTADHLGELRSFWREHCFVNVNIPNRKEAPLGIAKTWPGIKDYGDTVSVSKQEDESLLCALVPGEESALFETGSDCDAVSRNFVSVSSVYNFPVVLRELCPEAPDHAFVAGRR